MGEAQIRLVATEAEQRQSQRLGLLAFGGDLSSPFDPAAFADSNGLRFGAFEGDRLVAKLGIRPYHQLFGGRPVPMGGIAGVAVAPAHRGRGLAQQLLLTALERMRSDGQVVSSLYQTALGLYRSKGWELGGSMPSMRIRTVDLGRVRGGEDVSIRDCTIDDIDSVEALYLSFASARNGMLTRTGPSFPSGARDILELDGVPLAVRGDQVVGYASYSRGSGYGVQSMLAVHDLVGADAGAVAALIRHLSTWSSVALESTLRWSDDELAALLMPDSLPAPVELRRWMLRIVDLPGAVASRGWPRSLTAAVDLEVVDEDATWNAGRWHLSFADGVGEAAAGGEGTVRCTIGALAALYTCAYDTRALRTLGLLTGPDDALACLDAAFAGPSSVMLDYF